MSDSWRKMPSWDAGTSRKSAGTRETDELDRAVRLCWVKGDEFLRRRAVFVSRAAVYWRESSFRETARRCAQKDAAAMEEMAEFFHRQASGRARESFLKPRNGSGSSGPISTAVRRRKKR